VEVASTRHGHPTASGSKRALLWLSLSNPKKLRVLMGGGGRVGRCLLHPFLNLPCSFGAECSPFRVPTCGRSLSPTLEKSLHRSDNSVVPSMLESIW
jgi:hypothetical protein